MVYSLAPKSFLFVVTRKQLPYGNAYLMKKIKESVDKLKDQEKAYKGALKRSGSRKNEQRGISETAEQDEATEETKGESKQSHARHNSLNRSHRLD